MTGAMPAASTPLRDLLRDPRLGTPHVQVRDVASGEVLLDLHGSEPTRTASVLKVLTSAAALAVLGPERRIPTTAVRGACPGEVILVGGGDLTLSRLPSDHESFYPGAAHLDDLAAQVMESWRRDPQTALTPITRVVLDSTLFGGVDWEPSWDVLEERTVDGSVSCIDALEVDGDREMPLEAYSPRGDDPVARAGRAFADALGLDPVIERGRAPENSPVLGRVLSPPVRDIIRHGLLTSDNSAMEMLARLVAIESGFGNTFEAAADALVTALAVYGIATDGVRFVDGSGLSHGNAVPLSYITRLLAKIRRGEQGLGLIFDCLPASGPSGQGSLRTERFTGENAVVGGAVHAKTGWIVTAYTLAGLVRAADGTDLAFAVFALGDVDSDAKEAIDALVAEFYRRGARLRLPS